MTKLALLLALALAGCASAPTEYTYTMSPETFEKCKAQGGCHVVTVPELMDVLEDAYEMGRRDAR